MPVGLSVPILRGSRAPGMVKSFSLIKLSVLLNRLIRNVKNSHSECDVLNENFVWGIGQSEDSWEQDKSAIVQIPFSPVFTRTASTALLWGYI